ncbi:MAG: isocitrate/isopropylmalate family dehydrogenase [bacterium]
MSVFPFSPEREVIKGACIQLVIGPEQIDLMLLENLYDDIVSDLCAGLIGGPGLRCH